MAIPATSWPVVRFEVQAGTQAGSAAKNPVLAIVQKAGVLGFQLLSLWAISLLGALAVRTLALPIPGNLAGMVTLYVLLSTGVVKVAWLDAAATLLVKHLAFFFIPIAVGVMGVGSLLAEHGITITLTLVVSAMVGIALSGFIAQQLSIRSRPADGS